MKRTFLLMIISILCFLMVMPFSALAEPEDSSQNPVESSCEHVWEDDKDGTSGQHCSLCQLDYCEVNGHTEETPASCTKMAVCKICGEEYGETLPHVYTETNDCTAKVLCDNCGEIVKASGSHDWEPATCTKVKTCKTCGATEGDVLIHRWGEGTVTKTPTATANGSMRFVCEDCGLIKNQTIYFTSENEASPTDFVLPIIIGIIVVLIIAIIVVIIVIIRRRKR